MRTIHLGSGIGYEDGLKRQDAAVDALLNGSGEETLFLLEHAPVYTIGRLRDQSSLRDPSTLPAPVFETNRGGQATYHGLGQLVGYPILDLRERNRDLHAHLRGIEEALILTCHDFGIPAGRREGLTGVWVENRKLASIGVGVRKWISMHGFAINITPESLLPFFAITPCGIDGVIMSSVAQEARKPVTVDEFAAAFVPQFEKLFARS
ncbi:lipoyl(octanoyl) transferase LipB [Luteolibacter arcticus]|uniref:Octanoyltransferase n=1 Tax=Luteolibacter arcticus TaxID=1581411 RepID=A0ABT3GFB6_9BACT|nr:lipoyl(octanoyl) transferase LipB [Luteolibacter arcticus]MCW1921729.1 lipoyl(octanoyl) transferase LipB [Luteolibacter arcticus]